MGRPSIDPHKLDPQMLAVMKLHDEQGLSNKEAGNALGISESTVKRIRQRPAYHELATEILTHQCRGVEEYLKKLDDLSFNATKEKFDGYDKEKNRKYRDVPDYHVQTTNLHKIIDIFGMEPPKEHTVQHTLAGLSNEELFDEIEKTEQELGMDEKRGQSIPDVDTPEKEQGMVL